ncbi:MAG: hypothetical protein GX879_08900, partial [Bacteroidales bacterium]|nr:hypothetical protein [Bacteroidales bacterium]
MRKSLITLSLICWILATFAQTYNMSNTNITTCSGAFYDSGGSDSGYSSNEGLTMVFTSDNGKRLKFNFQSFSTESGYDKLYIYDGSSMNHTQIGVFSGTNSPGVIESTGTSICFYFSSDNSSNYSGWSAIISCTSEPLPVYNISDGGNIATCGAMFYDSGSSNDFYENNENYEMSFTSENSDYLICSFSFFDVHVSDTLFVYDGTTSDAPLIGKYYGNKLPETIYSKTSNSLCFKFLSNTQNVALGWVAELSCSPNSPAQNFNMQNGLRHTCGGAFYDSGGASANYSNYESYTLTFVSDSDSRLKFNFQTFSLENNIDKLWIYDGPSTSHPLIGMFSGTNSPGIIESSGKSLTFYFSSDVSNTYSGWSASISCTTPPLPEYLMSSGVINTCEGVFYDSGGPNESYLNNENSEMTFCSDNDDYIVFDFQENNFFIELNDTLFVYDGASSAAQLIGKYTGTQLPERISSKTGSCLTFKFVSNTVNSHLGWQALISCVPEPINSPHYNMQPGVRYTCGGKFFDSGGSSGNYSNGENKTMTFYSASNSRLKFDFIEFYTENGFDVLYVYDGPSTEHPQIAQLTGSTLPSAIESSGTSLTFRFYSDGSNTYSGWHADISCFGEPLPTYNLTSGTITTCEGVFYDSGGAAANYPHNENREMTFCSDNNDYIVFSFSEYNFNIYSDDTLFVYDGASSDAQLIGKYTGTQLPEVISSQTGSCLTFKFESNTVNSHLGWQAFISCTPEAVDSPHYNMQQGVRYTCGGKFFDSGGSSKNYSNSENKTMTFYSNSGSRLKFDFIEFKTENGWDVLYVYDGPTSDYPLIKSLSGSNLPPTIESTGTSLCFKFISDGSTTNNGWEADISCFGTALPTYNMSSGTINTCEGVFYDSGGAANNYLNNEDKTMSFCSETNEFIKVKFTENNFNLLANDSLFVYDGNSTSANILAIYTGNTIPEEFSSISGACLTFRFKSDATNNQIGWQAILSCIDTPIINSEYNITSGVRYTCDASFYDSGGSESNYSNNENKTMTFCSNSGCPITAQFNSFHTETNYDKLIVYDGMNITAPELHTCSGSNFPNSITSSGGCLSFKFNSDNSGNYAGWDISLTCDMSSIVSEQNFVACEGELVTLTASPGVSYLWSTGETTESIEVDTPGFYSVTVTNDENCNLVSDIVQVQFYDAPDVSIQPSGEVHICDGESITINASIFNNYLWNNGADTQSISVDDDGEFWVSVVDANGCVGISDTAFIFKNIVPVPSISYENNTLYVEPSSGYNFKWYFNGFEIENANENFYIPLEDGNYTVEIFDEIGCNNISNVFEVIGTFLANNVLNNSINVYPNPFSHQAEIFINLEKQEHVNIELY